MSDAQNGAQGRDDELRPTSGAEWRQARETGYVKRLWSGMVARIRTPDLAVLVEQGQVPDALTPMVTRMLFMGTDEADEARLQKLRGGRDLTPEEQVAWRETLRVVCVASFMEPRIVDDPQADDEIHIKDVHPADQLLVWDFAVGGAAMLKTFRAESFADVALALDRGGLEHAAEPAAADPDPG